MTIFTKIINGDIPSYKIAEDDSFLAFLDIAPMVKGHVLLIPKIEVNKLFDLDDNLLSRMLVFARPIAHAIESSFSCNRCGIAVIGLDVPHAHMHMLPLNTADDLNFNRTKLKLTHQEFKEVQEKLVQALRKKP